MNGRQYIGARYVPIFARPVEWDVNRSYEAFMVVLDEGVPYTSKKPVPVGVDIENAEYWVKTPLVVGIDTPMTGDLDMNTHALKNVQEIEFANSGAGLYVGSVIEPAGTTGARLSGTTTNRAAFVKPDTQASYVPVSVGTPTMDDDATTKAYVDGNFLALTGGTMTGDLLLSGAPTSGLMAASKSYVDEVVKALKAYCNETFATKG